MDTDLVPATPPIHRFDPRLTAWYGHVFQPRGDTVWTIEALHCNDGRRLFISDLIGNVQSELVKRYHKAKRDGKADPAKAGAEGRGAAAAAAATAAAAGAGAAAAGGGAERRRQRGVWRGRHMQRTCRMLEQRGLAVWPDDCGGGGCAAGAECGDVGSGAGPEMTVEALLPGGRVVRTVRGADARRVDLTVAHRRGTSPKIVLPRLTPAGRIVWLQTRLGLTSREVLVLSLIWPRFKAGGYFVKSNSMVAENVWMADSDITYAFYSLSRAGYIAKNARTGRFLVVRRADEIEPYGPMLEVIEDMVYGARAGEYVYGDTYDDEINKAYARTVASLNEDAGRRGANGGGASAAQAAAGRRRRRRQANA